MPDIGIITRLLQTLPVKNDLMVKPVGKIFVTQKVLVVYKVEIQPDASRNAMILHQVGYAHHEKRIQPGIDEYRVLCA